MKTLVLIAVLLVSTAFADDFKTADGKEYKNVTVTKVEPDGLTVETDSGIEKIFFAVLPKDVQEKYHYNPQAAAAFNAADAAAQHQMYQQNEQIQNQQTAAANQEAAAEVQADKPKITLVVSVIQVLDDGAIVQVLNTVNTGASDTVFMNGMKGIAEGERYDVTTYQDGTITKGDSTLQKWICVNMKKNIPVYSRPADSLQRVGGG